MYQEDLNCIIDTMRILVKEKDDKSFYYKSIKKIAKMMELGKELYTFNPSNPLVKITKIDYLGLQEFYQVKAFSGSRIIIGKDAEIQVDGEWIKIFELRFHEKIYEFNLIKDLYLDTYITDIYYYEKRKAYRVHIDDENGMITNNFMIRFPGACQPEVTELEEKPPEEEIKDAPIAIKGNTKK
ncbi:MAG: hypothetical protein FWG20_05565 [Candidatus Cloacimonetes bacterium]|nr:hypothetical protein [Candidatus Cloacimonadota bacterium]